MSDPLFVYADPHVHPHKGSPERLEDCLNALEWAFETALARGARDAVCAGDLFQDRRNIQVYAYHRVFKLFERFSGLRHWLLLGNHDLWFYERPDVSSVEPLGALPHVRVITHPCTLSVGGTPVDFLPFTHNPIPALRQFTAKSPVLVGHIAVDGAVLNFHHRTRSEVSVEFDNDTIKVGRDLFDGWGRVFLGHYHGAQRLTPRAEYVGSLLQLNFGEAFQDKHVILVHRDTLEVEYVKNEISPQHLILTAEEAEDHPGLDGNFVRIAVEPGHQVDVVEMKQRLASRCPTAQVTVVQEGAGAAADAKVEKFDVASGDVLERYVRAANPAGMDVDRLLSLGREICLQS